MNMLYIVYIMGSIQNNQLRNNVTWKFSRDENYWVTKKKMPLVKKDPTRYKMVQPKTFSSFQCRIKIPSLFKMLKSVHTITLYKF